MHRVPFRTSTTIQPPQLEPVEHNKYWSLGGWNRIDLSQEVDADAVDYVAVLESCKPWEHLRLPIPCSICKSQDASNVSVHWLYWHCITCPDFFACADCWQHQKFNSVQNRAHTGHKIIQITVRPLSAPLYDGSNLDQLQHFRAVKTADKFFLYFPWFFHCFSGFDQVREFNRKQVLEYLDSENSMSPQNKEAIRKNQDYPVDWYIRLFGSGDWKSLLESMAPLLHTQIQVAESSAKVHNLLLRLQKYREKKIRVYGHDDIPALDAVASYRRLVQRMGPAMCGYLTYSFALEFTNVLNAEINPKKLYKTLSAIDGVQQTKTSEIHQTTKTDHHHLEDIRTFWQLFRILFDSDPRFSELIRADQLIGRWSYFDMFKPGWQSLVRTDYNIRELLFSIKYDELSELQTRDLEPFDTLYPVYWCADETINKVLDLSERILQAGNYELALSLLEEKTFAPAFLVNMHLQQQRIHLSQGYYQRAAEVATKLYKRVTDDIHDQFQIHDFSNQNKENESMQPPIDRLASILVTIISAYANCFVKGAWEVALSSAIEVFEKYLRFENLSQQNATLFVHIELYYHRIILETTRDLGMSHPHTSALKRLANLREYFSKLKDSTAAADLALEILRTEVEIQKQTGRAQYPDFEDAFSVPSYSYRASSSLPLVLTLKDSCVMKGADKNIPQILANLLLLEANIRQEDGQWRTAIQLADTAKGIFSEISEQSYSIIGSFDHVGLVDVEDFKIGAADGPSPYAQISKLWNNLRSRNDIRRLQSFRKYNVAISEENTPEYQWMLYQRQDLKDLAKEAGDNIMYERWNLRKYAGDFHSIASINPSEHLLNGQSDIPVHSNLLVTIASFNLSKAYLNTGNYFEAAVNSLLHLGFVSQRNDTESFQRAVIQFLQALTEALKAQQKRSSKLIDSLAVTWDSWIRQSPYERWTVPEPRCDAIYRFIEVICFIPNLVAISSSDGDEPGTSRDVPSTTVSIVLNHLHMAFDLFDALPFYLISIIGPKLSIAAAATATFIGNKELAIRACWEGIRLTHSGDLYTKASLQIQAGNLMTLLGQSDPEHWLHVVPAGRSLLASSSSSILRLWSLSGTIMKFCEAEIYRFKSSVAEIRARMLTWKKKLNKDSDTGSIEERVSEAIEIMNLSRTATDHGQLVEMVLSRIAQRISISGPFDANSNLAALASHYLAVQSRELTLEMCLIIRDWGEYTGIPRGAEMWSAVQRYKAATLYQRAFSTTIPLHFLDAIKGDPAALRLYNQEQKLVLEGPQAISDSRLDDVRYEMHNYPSTQALLDYRIKLFQVSKQDLDMLPEITSKTFNHDVDIILVDWIQYHDYFLVVLNNISKGKLTAFDLIYGCTVEDVKSWIKNNIDVSTNRLSTTLGSFDTFSALFPLVEPIVEASKNGEFCKKGDLLVFSPSQELHAIPLHALPYGRTDDGVSKNGNSMIDFDKKLHSQPSQKYHPIIEYHPIVYAPSNIILKECITRSLSRNEGLTSARLFGRWGSENKNSQTEEDRIAASLKDVSIKLESVGIRTKTLKGDTVTHSALTSTMPHASLLHFHAHIGEKDLKQHLVLEPTTQVYQTDPRSTYQDDKMIHIGISASGNINPYFNLPPPSRHDDKYTLQDAFAVELQASLVVLLGCGSANQSITQSDDAIGLISAFFSTGATSIIATLWPFENRDASMFSEIFYANAFQKYTNHHLINTTTEENNSTSKKNVINLATAFQETIMELRACQLEGCKKKKSVERRLRCHVGENQSPYHWAQYVLWGSWICIGPDGLVKEP